MVGANGQKLTLKGEVWENYYRLKDERGLKQKRQEEQVRIFESFYGIHFFWQIACIRLLFLPLNFPVLSLALLPAIFFIITIINIIIILNIDFLALLSVRNTAIQPSNHPAMHLPILPNQRVCKTQKSSKLLFSLSAQTPVCPQKKFLSQAEQ